MRIINNFPEICLGQMDHFGSKMAHPRNFGSAVKISLNFAQ